MKNTSDPHEEASASVDLKVVQIPVEKLRPSPTNPRKHFPPDKQLELENSMREHGFTLSAMTVRPMKRSLFIEEAEGLFHVEELTPDGIQTTIHTAKTKREADAVMEKETGNYEIVMGERRWRAATAIGIKTAPAFVAELSDQKVLILQLVENLQRNDLSPMEEAEGYARVLEQRDDKGALIYTIARLSKEIGKSAATVSRIRRLATLDGEARKAVETGVLHYNTALLITRLPDSAQRAAAAKEILFPQHETGPLSLVRAEQIMESKFRRSLDQAAFDQNAADLVPMESGGLGERTCGGACKDCPFKAGNAKNLDVDIPKKTRNDVCLNPGCFDRKTDAHWALWQAGATDEAKKRRGATMKESLALYRYGDQLDWNSDYIDLSEHPSNELKPGAEDPGTWKKLVKGAELEVLVCPDRNGKIHELAKKSLAIAAAVAGGAKCFRKDACDEDEGSEGSGSAETMRKMRMLRMKERRARRLTDAVRNGGLRAIEAAISKTQTLPDLFWRMMLKREAELDGDGIAEIMQERTGMHAGDGWDEHEFVKLVDAAAAEELPGMAFRLLMDSFSYEQSGGHKNYVETAKQLGVDLKECQKLVRAQFEAAEKARMEIAPGLEWLEPPEDCNFSFDKSGVCDVPAELTAEMPKGSRVELAWTVARKGSAWYAGRRLLLGWREKDDQDESLLVSTKNGDAPTMMRALIDAAYATKTFLLKDPKCPKPVIDKIAAHIVALLDREAQPEPVDGKDLNWLTATPASDTNWKSALARANLPTLKAAQEKLGKRKDAKTALRGIEGRIKAIEKARREPDGHHAAPDEPEAEIPEAGKKSKPKMSAEAKARVAAAQRARWARQDGKKKGGK